MIESDSSSCCRQSQRSEPKTSPVKHCEWMRTSGEPECTSPITSATASSVLAPFPATVAKPWIRNCPQRVGNSADATCFTFRELTIKLYRFSSQVSQRWLDLHS